MYIDHVALWSQLKAFYVRAFWRNRRRKICEHPTRL